MAEWLPIQDAPRDGDRRVVLCEMDDGWQIETSYQDKKGDWIYQDCEPFFCLGYYMEPKFYLSELPVAPDPPADINQGLKKFSP